ncbi:hypothetical protein [Prescottella equi]
MPCPVDADPVDAVGVVEVEQDVARELVDVGLLDGGRLVLGLEVEEQSVDEQVRVGADQAGSGELQSGGRCRRSRTQRAETVVRDAHLIVEVVNHAVGHLCGGLLDRDHPALLE